MKNYITLLLTFCLVVSCSDREVQLPHTTNNDITEVIDVSPIYMFYDETKSDSVDFNRRNMISTTNWLVNIDKRLTLKQILPHLQYLQEKRHGDGMHTNENAKNYFTCFNPETKNLAFIEFTKTIYSKERWEEKHKENEKVYVRIYDDGTVSPLTDIQKGYDSFALYFEQMNTYFQNGSEKELILLFHEDLPIQGYIDIKTELLSLKEDLIKISENEFIFN